jgi:hypothetical protein
VRWFWFAALISMAASAWSMEIYRSIDEHGNIIYSDRPQGANAEPILIAAPRPVSRPDQAPAATAPSHSVPPELEPLTAEIDRDPTAEERASACRTARERLELYVTARRLYRTLPDGEREYLDSREIDQARAAAAADVQTWCG